jgi:hypothetical protein
MRDLLWGPAGVSAIIGVIAALALYRLVGG